MHRRQIIHPSVKQKSVTESTRTKNGQEEEESALRVTWMIEARGGVCVCVWWCGDGERLLESHDSDKICLGENEQRPASQQASEQEGTRQNTDNKYVFYCITVLHINITIPT